MSNILRSNFILTLTNSMESAHYNVITITPVAMVGKCNASGFTEMQ